MAFVRSLSAVYFKRSWPSLVTAISMLVLLPYCLWSFLTWNLVVEPAPDLSTMDFHELQFVFWGVAFIALSAASLVGEEHIRVWLFQLPITNKAITAWLLSSAAVSMSISLIIVDALYEIVFGGSWPIFWPAAFFAVATCVIQAIYWQFLVGRLRWLPYSIIIGIAMIAWFCFRVGNNSPSSSDFSWPLTIIDYSGLVVTAMLSSLVGLHAINRLRCEELSETFSLRDIPQAFDDLGRRLASRQNFDWRTRDAGMVWYQRRESGVFIAIAAVIGSVAPLPFIASIYYSSVTLPEFGDHLGVILTMPFAVSSLLGSCIATIWAKPYQSKGEHDMTAFFATKPITNKEFASSVHQNLFRAAFIVSFIVTLVWLLFYFLCLWAGESGIAFEPGQLWRDSSLGSYGFVAVFIMVLSVSYTSTCICANVVLLGRKHLIAPSIMGVCLFFVAVAAVFKMNVFGELSDATKKGSALCFMTLLAGGVVIALIVAKKRDLISNGVIIYAVCIAIAASIAIPYFAPTPIIGMCVGMFVCLMLGARPCCPLAIEWNRHR